MLIYVTKKVKIITKKTNDEYKSLSFFILKLLNMNLIK